jgi:hypothetical protein
MRAVGFALCPYDVTRDETSFGQQKQYFFARNWRNYVDD